MNFGVKKFWRLSFISVVLNLLVETPVGQSVQSMQSLQSMTHPGISCAVKRHSSPQRWRGTRCEVNLLQRPTCKNQCENVSKQNTGHKQQRFCPSIAFTLFFDNKQYYKDIMFTHGVTGILAVCLGMVVVSQASMCPPRYVPGVNQVWTITIT